MAIAPVTAAAPKSRAKKAILKEKECEIKMGIEKLKVPMKWKITATYLTGPSKKTIMTSPFPEDPSPFQRY